MVRGSDILLVLVRCSHKKSLKNGCHWWRLRLAAVCLDRSPSCSHPQQRPLSLGARVISSSTSSWRLWGTYLDISCVCSLGRATVLTICVACLLAYLQEDEGGRAWVASSYLSCGIGTDTHGLTLEYGRGGFQCTLRVSSGDNANTGALR